MARGNRWAEALRWTAVLVGTGVAAGLGGVVLTVVLHTVQHAAYGYGGETTFIVGEERDGAGRRALVLLATGVLSGLAWWAYRHRFGSRPNVRRALLDDHLPPGQTFLSAVLQIVTVGLGASLGREGAPREVGASWGLRLALWARLPPHHRRAVLAAGAGAGLAAVYNVPVAGVLFALETLLVSIAVSDVAITMVIVGVATAVSLVFLPNQATYALPSLQVGPWLTLAAVPLGPAAGLLAAGFSRLMRAASEHAPSGRMILPSSIVAFALLALVSTWRPEVLGNGRGPAQLVFAGTLALPVAALLMVLKPVATALCLRGGAVGGLLTPAFSTGSLLGLVVGAGWDRIVPGTPSVAMAVLGAAAVLASTMRAPLTALALGVEFTAAPPSFLLPLAVAVAGSVLTARGLEGTIRPRTDADIETDRDPRGV